MYDSSERGIIVLIRWESVLKRGRSVLDRKISLLESSDVCSKLEKLVRK